MKISPPPTPKSPPIMPVRKPAIAKDMVAHGQPDGERVQHVPSYITTKVWVERTPLGREVGAEGLPVLVAIGACSVAARDSHLVQVSGDSLSRLAINFAETVEAVTAASRHAVQKVAEQIVHHATS